MPDKIVSWTCERCKLPLYFLIEYESPSPDEGIRGGFYGVILANDFAWEGLDTSEREDDRCVCECTDREQEDLGVKVGEDYERGWEPYNV